MVRTQNPTAHAVRRDSFVDAAQGFIQSKGYEQMSIQDVLDELGASKGAFYHYFDSKQALLQAVVDRMVDAAVAAPVKIHGLFAGISRYKNARPELMAAILETWMSDDNAVVRERVWRGVSARLTPMLAEIVRQGNAEGNFNVGSPDDSAAILMALTMGLNQRAIELYVARQAGTITLEDVERTLGAYVEAFDRVLDAPPGSVVPVDLAVVRQWFGKQEIAT